MNSNKAIKFSVLDDCAAFASLMFLDYITILKATVALYGSSDGRYLKSSYCEEDDEFAPTLNIYANTDDQWGKTICHLINKKYPLNIGDGIFIWDTVGKGDDSGLFPDELRSFLRLHPFWIFPDLHVYGDAPPKVHAPREETFFRIAWNPPFNLIDGDIPQLYIDLEGPAPPLEKADYMLVLSKGYFDFLRILKYLIDYLSFPLQSILADYNEPCIKLPTINKRESICLPSGVVLDINTHEDADRSAFPTYRQQFNLIDSYKADIVFRFDLISREIEKIHWISQENNISSNGKSQGNTISLSKWSIPMTKEAVCRKLNWSRTKLRMRLTQYPTAIKTLGRQEFRFDCNNSSFNELPVDETYNDTLNK